MKKQSEEITVTKAEWEELILFFDKEISVMSTFIAFFLILAGAIYAASTLEINVFGIMVYVAYRIFVVSGIAAGLCFGRFLLLEIAEYRIKKQKVTIFPEKRPRSCLNQTKRELKGKKYLVLHALCFKYAFRLEDA